jgi:hypothetical protein
MRSIVFGCNNNLRENNFLWKLTGAYERAHIVRANRRMTMAIKTHYNVDINRHFAALDGRDSGAFTFKASTALDAASAANMAQVVYAGRIFCFVNAASLRRFKSGQMLTINDSAQALYITVTRVETGE